MQVILLTHEREASRATNTGTIALEHFPQYCQRITWSRVEPSELLLAKLDESGTALLFPPEEAAQLSEAEQVKAGNEVPCDSECNNECDSNAAQTRLPTTLIILDATWQEARKMLRQSPYLKTATRFSLVDTPESQFSLRRNQIEGGLCTVECIIELFKQADMLDEAAQLTEAFKAICQ